mmetsp:Transcript_3099/g.9174  ORF Transcript_3099/g.9174 Transcript_3099/m.9174 type:complete len:219 (-) Transcript_3099:2699-3355(-)
MRAVPEHPVRPQEAQDIGCLLQCQHLHQVVCLTVEVAAEKDVNLVQKDQLVRISCCDCEASVARLSLSCTSDPSMHDQIFRKCSDVALLSVLAPGVLKDRAVPNEVCKLKSLEHLLEVPVVTLAEVARITHAADWEAQQAAKSSESTEDDGLALASSNVHQPALQLVVTRVAARKVQKRQDLDHMRLHEHQLRLDGCIPLRPVRSSVDCQPPVALAGL